VRDLLVKTREEMEKLQKADQANKESIGKSIVEIESERTSRKKQYTELTTKMAEIDKKLTDLSGVFDQKFKEYEAKLHLCSQERINLARKNDDDMNHIKKIFREDLRKLDSAQKKDHDALYKLQNWVDEYKNKSTASVSKPDSPVEEQKSSTKSGE
jgi:hypothetical protein